MEPVIPDAQGEREWELIDEELDRSTIAPQPTFGPFACGIRQHPSLNRSISCDSSGASAA